MNPPTTSWWRRNRLWLALLVPLLLLAIAASSFRMVRIYLPWEWSLPIVAHGPSGTLRQEFLGFDNVRYTRTVDVQLVSVRSARQVGDVRAAPGALLWRTTLGFSAAPDQMVDACRVELVDAAGRTYDVRGAQEDTRTGDPVSTLGGLKCVPEDAPGPTIEPFTGVHVPSPVERPGSWELEFVIALPEGTPPEQVLVKWHEPEYLVLDVP